MSQKYNKQILSVVADITQSTKANMAHYEHDMSIWSQINSIFLASEDNSKEQNLRGICLVYQVTDSKERVASVIFRTSYRLDITYSCFHFWNLRNFITSRFYKILLYLKPILDIVLLTSVGKSLSLSPEHLVEPISLRFLFDLMGFDENLFTVVKGIFAKWYIDLAWALPFRLLFRK